MFNTFFFGIYFNAYFNAFFIFFIFFFFFEDSTEWNNANIKAITSNHTKAERRRIV